MNNLINVPTNEIANLQDLLIKNAKETIFLGTQNSKNTQIAYDIAVKQYLNFCTSINICVGSKESVILFLESIKTLKLASLQLKTSALVNYFNANNYDNFLLAKEYINFRKGLVKSKGTAQKQCKALQTTKNFYDKLDKITNEKHKTMFLTMFYGAFRYSEITSLKKENIDIDADRITIRMYKSKTNQQGAEELKSIPKLQDKKKCPFRALKTFVANMNDTDLLFCYSLVYVNRLVKKYFGKGFSSHSFRASFVTIAKKNGASNSEVMAQTKHKTDIMVNRYYRNENIHQNNAVNVL
jgi:integrase